MPNYQFKIFFYILITIFLIKEIISQDDFFIKLKLDKIESKKENKYEPITIKYDYSSLNKEKNKRVVRTIKQLLYQVSEIFSQILNIKDRKIIQVKSGKLCNLKLNKFNAKLQYGIDTDILIYPVLTSTKDVDNQICAVDSSNNRPIIAMLLINEKMGTYTKRARNFYFMQFVHHITHILGFKDKFMKKLMVRKRLSFNSLNSINEKTYNKWQSSRMKKGHYIGKNYDIMSNKNGRFLAFSSQTLVVLQNLKWYQVNLGLCGCSLDGDCEYLNHPISIYISSNLNGDYNAHCYLDKNQDKKCTQLNDTFIPKTKLKKVNTNVNTDYFNGGHCINTHKVYDPHDIPFNMTEQTVHLLHRKKNGKCKNPQRTLYFYYNNKTNLTNYEIDGYEIENYTIKDKNMFVYHTSVRFTKATQESFYQVMEYNNIPFINNYFFPNFLNINSYIPRFHEYIGTIGKYQIINKELNSVYDLFNKARLFKEYRKYANEFPKDFNFHPESYLKETDKEILKKKFKGYKFTKDDLWIYKPPGGSLGLGIKFMKNENDFLKYSFITRYIPNPHLIYGTKYHIRIYLILTGVLPLKLYMFDEGQVMRAASQYETELDKIEKPDSMLTNVHHNHRYPNYNTNITFNGEEGSEWTLKTLGKYINRHGGNWEKLWEEVVDVCIKTILFNYDKMQKAMLEEYKNLRSNNIAHRYGFDVMFDSDLKPWLLEVNTGAMMELYNLINVYHKIQVDTDYMNLIGMVPFNHVTDEPLDKEMEYKDKIDESLQIAICEFERTFGGLSRVFPVKKTLNYYKKFIKYHDEYNKALWDLIEKGQIE